MSQLAWSGCLLCLIGIMPQGGSEVTENAARAFSRRKASLNFHPAAISASNPASAQQAKDCKKCREYQQACLKNHTRDACNSEYNICIKYCGKK
jgi:hypothetical protein